MATKSKRFKRCLCIQQGTRRFAADGDSGSVIFEITKENNHILLKGLELLFGLLEHQYHHFILASPLLVVIEAFTTEHPNGSGLELVSKYIEGHTSLSFMRTGTAICNLFDEQLSKKNSEERRRPIDVHVRMKLKI